MKSNTLAKTSLNKNLDCLWYRIANNMMQPDTTILTHTNALNSEKITPQSAPETQEITYNWYRRIQDMPDIWSVLDIEDIFLSKAYLSMLEEYTPDGMNFVYWVFFKGQRPVGFLYGQIQRFDAYDSVTSLQTPPEGNWSRFKYSVRKRFVKSFKTKILFIGNLLVTGEHSFYFNESDFRNVNIVELIDNTLKESLSKIGEKNVRAIFFKEYFEEKASVFDELKKEQNYHPINTEPNMIVDIRSEWKGFDDYLQAMSSKYRVRAKRAFKKGKEIEKRELTLEEIDQNNERIFDLYQQTANNAAFNALFLNERYFCGLKALLKDDFQLIGYFLEGELIGYYTLIHGANEIDAHFLGIDNRFNSKYQVYLNMLYDMIRIGIQRKTKQIIMARTAMEIKSSVGAVAHEMYSYLKIRNGLLNRNFYRYSGSFVNPTEWTPRQPFKDKK